MLVTTDNFDSVLRALSPVKGYAVDTETTGLKPYQGSRLFSIIISDETDDFYFNFNQYPNLPREHFLTSEHLERLGKEFFAHPYKRIYMHNAKFDLSILSQSGIEVAGEVFCTYAMGRILRGDLFNYSLDALAKRWLKEDKDDAVADYIDKHKLYTKIESKDKNGKKKSVKHGWYHKVPLEVMQPYAEKDTRLCYKLGKFQEAGFRLYDEKKLTNCPSLALLLETEIKLTKTLYNMEKRGIKVDIEFCKKAIIHEKQERDKAAARYEEITGKKFIDSYIDFRRAFTLLNIPVPSEPRGGFNKEFLSNTKHEIAELILTLRTADKKISTYYQNFIDFADHQGLVHPNFRQGGTKTGRLSCSDPNLQNLKKNEEEDELEEVEGDDFSVRKAFIPVSPEHCFFLPDYKQMEYFLMLNYAGETKVIDLVKQGMDVHTATAETMGVTRTQAKTINFMLIYGGGIANLASKLKVTLAEAKELKARYFAKLPKIKAFIESLPKVAERRGYSWGWTGRRYICAPEYSYRMPNHVIQGGCADIVRLAMVKCDEYLEENKVTDRAWQFLQVHDELGFSLHKSVLDIAPDLMKIMETVYPAALLPMACDPSFSWKSLGDKVKGFPV